MRDKYHARCQDCDWREVRMNLDGAVGARREHMKRHSEHKVVLRKYPRSEPEPRSERFRREVEEQTAQFGG